MVCVCVSECVVCGMVWVDGRERGGESHNGARVGWFHLGAGAGCGSPISHLECLGPGARGSPRQETSGMACPGPGSWKSGEKSFPDRETGLDTASDEF